MSKDATKQFSVGDGPAYDFSKHEIDTLIYKIALWFTSPECDRNYDDPEGMAREKVSEALLAETSEGRPWKNAPSTLAARIKVKCAYDMEKDEGIPISQVKNPHASRALSKGAQQSAKALKNRSSAASTFDVEKFRQKVERDILDEFPQLDNPAHRPNVRRLSLVYSQQEVVDRELLITSNAKSRDTLIKQLEKLESMSANTLKTLGIHPDQIRKNVDKDASASVADLVAMLGDDDEFADREKKWALQLALQLWWMANHANGKGDGPQMSDWEIWHMTRSRPIKFTCEHGETYQIVEGFEPDDLRDYLLAEGVLVEKPVVPQLIPQESIVGLAGNWRLQGGDVVEDTVLSEESEVQDGTGDDGRTD